MPFGEIIVLVTDPQVCTRLRGMARECRIGPEERAKVEWHSSKTAAGTLILRCNLWAKRLGFAPGDLELMSRGESPRRKPCDITKLDEVSVERLAQEWGS